MFGEELGHPVGVEALYLGLVFALPVHFHGDEGQKVPSSLRGHLVKFQVDSFWQVQFFELFVDLVDGVLSFLPGEDGVQEVFPWAGGTMLSKGQKGMPMDRRVCSRRSTWPVGDVDVKACLFGHVCNLRDGFGVKCSRGLGLGVRPVRGLSPRWISVWSISWMLLWVLDVVAGDGSLLEGIDRG